MNRDPRRAIDRAHDILDAIDNINHDLGALSREAFLSDGKTQRAVIEGFIVVGEAANRLCDLLPALENESPELWAHLRDAYDMRIILTHEYFRVDAGIVWETIQQELPVLKALVDRSVLNDSRN